MTDDEREQLYNTLLPLATDDYQNRDGNYPESDEADTIQVSNYSISADFKNTSCRSAKRWLYRFLTDNGFNIDEDDIETRQDGDYDNDWVIASISLCKIKNNVKI